MMQSLTRRYGAWQVRDYVTERGVWTVLLGFALLALFWMNYDPAPPGWMTRPSSPAAGGGDVAAMHAQWLRDEPRRFADQVEMLFTLFGFLGTLIATHGIVSRDRERGFHRFLFAKPVPMPSYYAQAFAVNGAGLLVVATGLLALTALLFGRAVPVAVLGVVGTEYVVLGGTVFLLSALWRFDFVLAALSWPLAALAGSLARAERWGFLPELVAPILPPALRLGRFVGALTGPSAVQPLDPVIVLGYGVLSFAAGLYVLRRRAGAR
jgi:ABC-type transport system involved in multi-copper enzyme maturation permease subunit